MLKERTESSLTTSDRVCGMSNRVDQPPPDWEMVVVDELSKVVFLIYIFITVVSITAESVNN